MNESLREVLVSGENVFEGRLIQVRRDLVALPDGTNATREYVQHPGACVVIPEVSEGVFVFERQYRHALRKEFIELPAGKLDHGESLLECARRELLEETGYSAQHWQHLGVMHNCIGYSDEKIEIFYARDLSHSSPDLDEGELIDVFQMDLEEAERAVFEGRITDAKTITCLFWMRNRLSRNGSWNAV